MPKARWTKIIYTTNIQDVNFYNESRRKFQVGIDT